jgi:hypothetical protein
MIYTEEKLSKIKLLSKLFKGFADYSRLLIFFTLLDGGHREARTLDLLRISTERKVGHTSFLSTLRQRNS